jgi:tape measure domain-containing protein
MVEIASVSIVARLDFSQLDRDYKTLESSANKAAQNFSRNFTQSLRTSRLGISDAFRGKEATNAAGRVGSDSASHFAARFTSTIRREEGRMSNAMKGIWQGVGQSITTGLVGAAAAGIQAIGGLGSKILSAGADAEKAKVQFTTFLGSAEEAGKALREVTEFAASTPFELPEVKKAATQLLAFGISSDELKSKLRSVGDIAAGVGVPFNELADIYGKLKVQGRAYAEDINQLQGRGIPIIQELAKTYGKSTEQIREMVKEGKIGFKEIDAAFTSMTSKGGKFEGMMANLAQTTAGKLSNMSDSITAGFTAIFSTLQPVINESIDLMSAFLGGMNIDLKAGQGLAQGLANWLRENQDEAKAFGAAVSSVINGSLRITRELSANIKAYFDKYPGVLKIVGAAVELVKFSWGVFSANVGATVAFFGDIANLAGKIVGFVDRLVSGTASFLNNIKESAQQWAKFSAINLGFGGSGGPIDPGTPFRGGYTITDPHDSNVTSYEDSSAHHTYQRTHRGVVKDFTARDGRGSTRVPLPAAMTGRVSSAGSMGGYGNAVEIVNERGEKVILGHLETVFVKVGQRVQRGQAIGIQGHTGNVRPKGPGGTHGHIEGPEHVVDAYYDLLRGGRSGGGKLSGSGGPSIAELTAVAASVIIPEMKKLIAYPSLNGAFGTSDVNLGLNTNYASAPFSEDNIKSSEAGKESLSNLIGESNERHRKQQAYDDEMAKWGQAKMETGIFAPSRERMKAVNIQYEATMAEEQRLVKVKEMSQQLIESQKVLSASMKESFYASKELEVQMIDGLGASVKEAFSSVILGTKSLGEAALDMLGSIASKLADLALNSILGGAGSGKGILGGLFGSLGGSPISIGGGSRGALLSTLRNINSYDTGTPYVPYTQVAMVHQGEKIIPANENRGGASGGVSITINQHNSPGDPAMTDKQARETAKGIERIVEATLLRQMRSGGALGRSY